GCRIERATGARGRVARDKSISSGGVDAGRSQVERRARFSPPRQSRVDAPARAARRRAMRRFVQQEQTESMSGITSRGRTPPPPTPSTSATPTERSPPAAGDDIIVGQGVTVTATTGDVDVDAGDNVTIDGTVQATAAGQAVSITAGIGGNDGIGAIIVPGTISA